MAGEFQAQRWWWSSRRRRRARATASSSPAITSTSSRGGCLVGGGCKIFPSPRERCRRGPTRCTTDEEPARPLLDLEPWARRRRRGIFVYGKRDLRGTRVWFTVL
ncbi:hypothetical protein SETIT_9G571300v2 [Setaria italica]|uniref:Uncharacterized protein n=1 Tax=Setaria italica TaxID=4555 RepID=A0A368SWX8_SETIT|nr:hypothetical protein SETIT_9G571300v2 [Setaria italica]